MPGLKIKCLLYDKLNYVHVHHLSSTVHLIIEACRRVRKSRAQKVCEGCNDQARLEKTTFLNNFFVELLLSSFHSTTFSPSTPVVLSPVFSLQEHILELVTVAPSGLSLSQLTGKLKTPGSCFIDENCALKYLEEDSASLSHDTVLVTPRSQVLEPLSL